MHKFRVVWRALLFIALAAAGPGTSLGAAPQGPIPDNIGGGLRPLIEGQANTAAQPSAVAAAALLEPRVLRDDQRRVLVNVWLDGGRSVAAVHQSLTALGASVVAELPTHRNGVISAYVPLDRALDAAHVDEIGADAEDHVRPPSIAARMVFTA